MVDKKYSILLREVEMGRHDLIPELILASRRVGAKIYKPEFFRYFCKTHNRLIWKDQDCPMLEQTGESCDLDVSFDRYGVKNWISDASLKNKYKHNMFSLKKSEYPEPIDPDIFMEAFFSYYQDTPVWFFFENEIRDFYSQKLGDLVNIVANLNILPRTSTYPIQSLTPEELIEATNLDIDLIRNIRIWDRPNIRLNRRIGFCHENTRPLTILGVSSVYQDSRNSPWTGRPSYSISLYDNTNWESDDTWPVTLGIMG